MKPMSGAVCGPRLQLVAKAPPPDVPPLFVGDRCSYNSGSPPLLVVDCDQSTVTVAWECDRSIAEHTLPRACVRRST